MALTAGDRLDRYEIISLLGTGGMGEVYLAEDTRLDRRVALKLLPAQFTQDADRVRRFVQEAKSSSALNHPNILMIFEIGQTDSTHYIATEFIEGVTLRKHLAKSRMSLHEVLDVIIQVAGALASAHAAGITHRDIKPENVMLRPDGYVKVLDFGLAKLAEPQSSPADTQAPTIAKVSTDPGTVMGTVTYMSPEQARGSAVDARSDIFSLGVVIYEMLAGRAPFEGETASDIIASILKTDPSQLARYSAEVTPELQWIVSKALRKDRDERYQSSKELLSDLKNLKRELDVRAGIERSVPPESSRAAAVLATASGQAAADTARESIAPTADVAARTTSSAEVILSEIKRHKKGAVLTLAILLIVMGGIGFGLYKLVGHKQSAPATPLQTMKFTRLTTTGKATRAAISPDGKYVVHVVDDEGQQSLWLRQVVTTSNAQIVPPGDVHYDGLAFSPDGNFIYFVRNEGNTPRAALYQVPILGGALKKLNSNALAGFSLSPDGKRLVFGRENQGARECAAWISNIDGSDEQKIAAVSSPKHIYDSTWSPDGKSIAYVTGGPAGGAKVVALDLETRTERTITTQPWRGQPRGLAWLADGSGLIIVVGSPETGRSAQLWHISHLGGELRRITNDLNDYSGLSLTSDSSALVTVQTDVLSNIWVAPGGDASRAKQITAGASRIDGTFGVSWTPDGRIVHTQIANGRTDIWIMDQDGSNQEQLTSNGGNFDPTVTPDGRYVVFFASGTIWRMDLDGGNLKQLTSGGASPHCTPDGKWVIYRSRSRELGRTTLSKVSIDGGEPVLLTDRRIRAWALSPDGTMICNLSYRNEEEDLDVKIEVISLDGGQVIKSFNMPSTAPIRDTQIGWTPAGRGVTYIDMRKGVSNIWSQPLDGSPPKQLTNFTTEQIRSYGWSRDGKTLACGRGGETRDVVLISNLR